MNKTDNSFVEINFEVGRNQNLNGFLCNFGTTTEQLIRYSFKRSFWYVWRTLGDYG